MFSEILWAMNIGGRCSFSTKEIRQGATKVCLTVLTAALAVDRAPIVLVNRVEVSDSFSGWWFHPIPKILVNWDDYPQYIVPNHQPATFSWFHHQSQPRFFGCQTPTTLTLSCRGSWSLWMPRQMAHWRSWAQSDSGWWYSYPLKNISMDWLKGKITGKPYIWW